MTKVFVDCDEVFRHTSHAMGLHVLSDAAAAAILHSIWQNTLIAVALWVALRSTRQVSASSRYVMSCAALAAMVILPMATFVTALSGAAAGSIPRNAGIDRPADLLVVMADGSRIWTDRSLAPRAVLASLHAWIVPLWLAGAAVASIRVMWASGHVRVIRGSGMPAPGEVMALVNRMAAAGGAARRIAVVVTALTRGPATVGWLEPVILLPPALLTGLSTAQLEAILAHEIAHIRRHDYVVNLLQMAVETLLFYHPAVWWASRQIRVERELCCDDAAVQASGNRRDYAHALAAVARHAVTGTAMGVGGPSLPHRVHRLMTSPRDSPRAGAGVLAAALLVVAVAVGMGTWVQAQARPATGNRDAATVSLTVFDPLGEKAAGVPVVFEQGAFQDGALFGDGITDADGRYTVSLPAGTYLFSALIDFFPSTEITLRPGERVERDVRMQLQPMTGALTVCIDCRAAAAAAPQSIAEELQRDREGYATALTRTAEPADGWERYRVEVPASLRQLDRSIAGMVTVAGRVGVDGRLKDLRTVSSAHPALSDAALGALAAQRWVPARIRATPVEVELLFELQFVWESDR